MADPAEGDGLPYTAVTCDVTVARGYTNVVFTEKYSFSGPWETRVTTLVSIKSALSAALPMFRAYTIRLRLPPSRFTTRYRWIKRGIMPIWTCPI